MDVKQKVYIHSQWPNCVEIPSTKLWISDIPLSCANEDIESALSRLGVVLRSKLIQEKNRNRDGKLTHFLTGRCFVFMNVPSFLLEKSVKIGGFSARLYHKEQPKMERQQAVCSRCLQRGPAGSPVAECQNDVTRRACGVSGHKRGDPTCSGERAVNNQPIGEGGVVGWLWW